MKLEVCANGVAVIAETPQDEVLLAGLGGCSATYRAAYLRKSMNRLPDIPMPAALFVGPSDALERKAKL